MKSRVQLSALVLLSAALGCGTVDDPPEVVSTLDLPCASMAGSLWQSVGWPPAPACDWFDFQGTTTYRFAHALGAVPTVVLGYIAFEPDGASSTIAHGDSFLVTEVTAADVTIRNGTNQNFYLRLVLQ